MTSTDLVLNALAERLIEAGAFAAVTIAPAAEPSVAPRATVALTAIEHRPAEDAGSTWQRGRAEVTIRSAAGRARAGVSAALELVELSRASLLVDPFLGGLCVHLPWGPALVVESVRFCEPSTAPFCEVRMQLTFHQELT